jgi:hypothetical protein
MSQGNTIHPLSHRGSRLSAIGQSREAALRCSRRVSVCSTSFAQRNLRISLIFEISSSHGGEYEVQIRDDRGSAYLWNVGRQLFYTAAHPRRQIWTRLILFNDKTNTISYTQHIPCQITIACLQHIPRNYNRPMWTGLIRFQTRFSRITTVSTAIS